MLATTQSAAADFFLPEDADATPDPVFAEWEATCQAIAKATSRTDAVHFGEFSTGKPVDQGGRRTLITEETTDVSVALEFVLADVQAEITLPALARQLRHFADELDRTTRGGQ